MQAPRYYPPVEETELVRVIRLIFANRSEFLTHIAPQGFANSEYVLNYRPGIYKAYLRHRYFRIHYAGSRDGRLESLMEFTKQELLSSGRSASVNPDLESTMFLGDLVINVFHYPHAVFNESLGSYRFPPHRDKPFEFCKFLHDVLYTDGVLPKPFSPDFNFRCLKKYGDSLYRCTAIDYQKAYQFVFVQLKTLGLDWDFGSEMYRDYDRAHFRERNDENDWPPLLNPPEDHSSYDPSKNALTSVSSDDEDEDDWNGEEPPDQRTELLLDIAELIEDSKEMWRCANRTKNLIKAYESVFNRLPRSYPPMTFGKDCS